LLNAPLLRVPGRERFRPSVHTCPECGEPIWVFTEENGAESFVPCLECHRRRMEQEFIRSAREDAIARTTLNPRASFAEFETTLPYQQRGLRAAQAFCREARVGIPVALILWGNFGTGKTHLASAIANELTAAGWHIVAVSVPDLLARIRASYADEAASEYSIIRDLATADLLVMDEMGLEHVANTAWHQEKMYQIINGRYVHGPLVVTTNKQPTEMTSWIGPASFSRLWQMSDYGRLFVDMRGSDYRMRTIKRLTA